MVISAKILWTSCQIWLQATPDVCTAKTANLYVNKYKVYDSMFTEIAMKFKTKAVLKRQQTTLVLALLRLAVQLMCPVGSNI